VAAANLASEEMTEVVDDKGDMKRDQGGRCCLGKSSREGYEKTKSEIAAEKRKMATGGGGKERTRGKEKQRTDGRREGLGGGQGRALFGDILEALSKGLEVFLGTCREGVVLMEAVATSFVTVEDLSCS